MRKLLVANRGEIAVCIISAAQSLGIATVAVYSGADATARQVALADEAVLIGPPRPLGVRAFAQNRGMSRFNVGARVSAIMDLQITREKGHRKSMQAIIQEYCDVRSRN